MLVLRTRLEVVNFLLKIDHKNAGNKIPKNDVRLILKYIIWIST